jgi:hypothetical protein
MLITTIENWYQFLFQPDFGIPAIILNPLSIGYISGEALMQEALMQN